MWVWEGDIKEREIYMNEWEWKYRYVRRVSDHEREYEREYRWMNEWMNEEEHEWTWVKSGGWKYVNESEWEWV